MKIGDKYTCWYCWQDIDEKEEFIPKDKQMFLGFAFHKKCYPKYKDKEIIQELVCDPLRRKSDALLCHIVSKIERHI